MLELFMAVAYTWLKMFLNLTSTALMEPFWSAGLLWDLCFTTINTTRIPQNLRCLACLGHRDALTNFRAFLVIVRKSVEPSESSSYLTSGLCTQSLWCIITTLLFSSISLQNICALNFLFAAQRHSPLQ